MHNSCPIACLWGQDMGHILWVQSVTYVSSLSLMCWMNMMYCVYVCCISLCYVVLYCIPFYSTLMVICPCRVGGAVWNHTAWLFPLMPLPTLSLFYSYFLSGNKYRKNITCENIGQFQFCINLLPLELIWRSASCPRHWNQRWFGDAAFTIPSGKQWDHMSPWPPSWLSAGIEECCRSANESGHQWLKNSWLETIWH